MIINNDFQITSWRAAALLTGWKDIISSVNSIPWLKFCSGTMYAFAGNWQHNIKKFTFHHKLYIIMTTTFNRDINNIRHFH